MKARTSAERLDPPSLRNQALDGIRGLATLSVALGHCYLGATGLDIWSTTLRGFPAMSGRDIGYRLLSAVLPADCAVMVFFVLSGYVLWQSFVKRRLDWERLPDYIRSRIWRLFPLIISVTLMITVFSPAGVIETLANYGTIDGRNLGSDMHSTVPTAHLTYLAPSDWAFCSS